jgi:hypothetical protein
MHLNAKMREIIYEFPFIIFLDWMGAIKYEFPFTICFIFYFLKHKVGAISLYKAYQG